MYVNNVCFQTYFSVCAFRQRYMYMHMSAISMCGTFAKQMYTNFCWPCDFAFHTASLERQRKRRRGKRVHFCETKLAYAVCLVTVGLIMTLHTFLFISSLPVDFEFVNVNSCLELLPFILSYTQSSEAGQKLNNGYSFN